MRMPPLLVLSFLVTLILHGVVAENDRPIIGILAQEAKAEDPGDTYIWWNYVVYLESAGARVAPIRVKESDEYYRTMFNGINGILFPGGGVSLNTSEYAKAGQKLYDMAVEANKRGDYFPLWGTCLGFQFIAKATAGSYVLHDCYDENRSVPISPKAGARDSRVLRGMSDDVYYATTHWNISAMFHRECLFPDVYNNTPRLRNNLTVLATNIDMNGTEYISMYEGKRYPFYGTQFHPEKNNMMWDTSAHLNHSRLAVEMSQYFANFFVAEARKSNHHFPDIDSESRALIYNYQYSYVGQPTFRVNYYFNYTQDMDNHLPSSRLSYSSLWQRLFPAVKPIRL